MREGRSKKYHSVLACLAKLPGAVGTARSPSPFAANNQLARVQERAGAKPV